MIAKPKRSDFQSQASRRTRKRIVLMLGTIAIIGNATSLILYMLGLSNNGGRGFPTVSSAVIALAVVMIGLAIYNRVELAGFTFCLFGVGSITYTLLPSNLPTLAREPGAQLDTNLIILYPLLVLIAGTVVSARAAFVIGVTSILAYLASSIYFISLVPPPAPAQLGNTTAFNCGVLIAFTIIIYIFSRSLTVIAQTARRQAAELQDANTSLQRQRQLEGSINRQISMLSTTLGTVFRQQTNTTREQVSLVSEVASTTQELDAAARRIADSALSVAIVAEKALKSAQSGQQAASDGINAITSLRYQVENITESVRYLSNQIERISEVTDIIGEIADETNLLALNATIEAAGAREYGRRFAAVAEEVSRLSRRASLSVEQIQDLVEEVTSASSRSIAATEAGLKQALQGTDLVNRLSDANDEIILLVNQTSALAASIANATQQQRTASEQIVLNIDRINETATDLATTVEDVNRIVSNLETSTEQLAQTELFGEDAELSVAASADGGQPGQSVNKVPGV